MRRMVQELEVHRLELEAQNAELKAARLAIEALLTRYTQLFDFAPLGYAVVGPDGIILEVNHAGARFLQHSRGVLVGASLRSLLEPNDRPAFMGILRQALEAGERASCQVQATVGGATLVSLRFTASALASEGPAVLLAFEDVTEQEVRDEKMAATERTLRDADRRKDDLLAALSHGLRNPLTPIRSCLFLLDQKQFGGESARRAQLIMERQVTHLTQIIDDLLEVTRIGRGKVRLDTEPIDLEDLVQETFDGRRAEFEARGLRLEGRFGPGPFSLSGDRDRLVRSLENLLSNAATFTPSGGRVVVELQRAGTQAVLRVRDTGAGIAPELREHLFEPFVQGPQSIDRPQGGFGLGLAMVKGVVELHGGTVAVTSEGTGRGTEIMVSIPLATAADVASEPAAAADGPRRVLVIDDNRDGAQSLKDVLELEGHDVELAFDGESGLERARTFHPDVVICDVGLPLMDGYDVARALRAEEDLSGTYLVALTGHDSPEDLQRSADAGFDRHLTKPAFVDDLDRIVRCRPLESLRFA